MERKPLNFIIPFVLAVVFIGFGDKFLPQPLSGASLQTRTALNNFMLGLFPKKNIKNQNDERNKQIEDFEKQR